MSQSEGILKLSFKSEEAVKDFVSNWQDCNGNFLIDAEICEVYLHDDLVCDVKLRANCGAFWVDDEFYYAYQKGIKKSDILVSNSLYFNSQEGEIRDQVAGIKSLLAKDYADFQAELLYWESPDPYNSPILRLDDGIQSRRRSPSALGSTFAGNGAAVNQLINYGEGVPQEMVQAVSYCTLYAQAATKAQLRDEGVDITKSDIYKTRRYNDLMIQYFTRLGLIVMAAGDGNIQVTQRSGKIQIAEILNTVVGVYLTASMMSQFMAMQTLLQMSVTPPGIDNFLTFWWNSSSFSTSDSQFTTSPIEIVNGNPQVTMVFYTYNYAATHWRSLFVEFESKDFRVYSNGIKLSLNMDLYNRVIYPLIYPLIAAQIAQNIVQTPLVF